MAWIAFNLFIILSCFCALRVAAAERDELFVRGRLPFVRGRLRFFLQNVRLGPFATLHPRIFLQRFGFLTLLPLHKLFLPGIIV